jgi:uncharacterized protein
MMSQAEALSRLRRCAPALRAAGATALYLFGSVARNEAQPGSDLDLFVEYDLEGRFSLLDLVGIKQLLEEEVGVPVDVTTRNSLHPLLRADIKRSAVQVF